MSDRPSFSDDVRRWEAYWKSPFRPLPTAINWLGPNLWTGAILIVCILVSRIPIRSVYLGILDRWQITGLVTFGVTLLVQRALDSFISAVEDFCPKSATEAKRANEQVKLTATLLNASAIGAIGFVVYRNLFDPEEPNGLAMIAAVALGYWLHVYARSLLGHVKDEAPAAAS